MAYTEIGGADELRDLLGLPSGRAVTKERTRLHAVDLEWLAVSPFCIVATSDADGNCDASPKGDPAGHLVHVLDGGRNSRTTTPRRTTPSACTDPGRYEPRRCRQAAIRARFWQVTEQKRRWPPGEASM